MQTPKTMTLLFAVAACGPSDGGGAASTATASAAFSVSPEPEQAPGPGRVDRNEWALAPLRERPAFGPRRVCTNSVCVHFSAPAAEASAWQLATSSSSALTAMQALRLPRPLADVEGGDGRLDVYLDAAAAAPAAFLDPGSAASGIIDKGAAFIVTPALGAGCFREQGLASAVARVTLLGQDAALEPNALSMLGDYLATIVAPCSVRELEAVDSATRSPERTFSGARGEDGVGSFLFPWFLEDSYGTGEPGKLAIALAAISSQRTRLGALLDEPDMFDALRVTQHRNGTSAADTLLEFAVDRAFLGSRSDEAHMIDVARYGDLGRVRIEWNVSYASLPRRLAPLRPIEPLGMTYFLVDLKGAPANAELTFVAEWESPVAFRWALVKLDASGSEIGRQEVAPVLGETRMEKSLRELGGATHVLVVGLNEGESTRDEPFDPGEQREGARSFLLTIYP